jgi:micrococcal nuclease
VLIYHRPPPASVVREGYAQVLTIPPNVKYAEVLLACQQEARRHNRGLWGR